MASVLTNAGSMAALETLRSISRDMSTTQDRISSGLKVGSASDNAAYWSISTTMQAQSSSLSVVGEALGMGASLADVSSTAIESLVDLTKQIRDRIVASGESTNDLSKIKTELAQLTEQMTNTVAAAAFNGVNWLAATGPGAADLGATTKVLSGVTAGTFNYINVSLEATGAVNASESVAALNTAVTALAAGAEQTALTAVDKALGELTELGAKFGAASSRITTQTDFISSLTDAIDRGVGALIDADMNEESTRLKALQTQQQLAVQSLSIANSSTDLILQLFR